MTEGDRECLASYLLFHCLGIDALRDEANHSTKHYIFYIIRRNISGVSRSLGSLLMLAAQLTPMLSRPERESL